MLTAIAGARANAHRGNARRGTPGLHPSPSCRSPLLLAGLTEMLQCSVNTARCTSDLARDTLTGAYRRFCAARAAERKARVCAMRARTGGVRRRSCRRRQRQRAVDAEGGGRVRGARKWRRPRWIARSDCCSRMDDGHVHVSAYGLFAQHMPLATRNPGEWVRRRSAWDEATGDRPRPTAAMMRLPRSRGANDAACEALLRRRQLRLSAGGHGADGATHARRAESSHRHVH